MKNHINRGNCFVMTMKDHSILSSSEKTTVITKDGEFEVPVGYALIPMDEFYKVQHIILEWNFKHQ